MRIVFDNIVFSLQKAGGISVVWQEILSRFFYSELAHDIECLEYEHNKDNIFWKLLDFSKVVTIKKNPICFVITRYLNPHIRGSEPFIFHSSYYRTTSNRNAINITTIHDFTYDYFYKHKHRGAFLHLWQRNRAIRKADAVICISENTKRDLMKFIPDVNPQKIHVIYNGVSQDYRVSTNKVDEYKDYLLFVGGRNAFKNGRFFVDSIKDTHYKVVFCGKPLTQEEELFFNEKLGKDRYKILTGISNKELNRLYNSVKCLVYPSSYEGFGIPIIEAQSAGCPVIALNTSSIPEVIGDTPLMIQELTKDELLSKLKMLDDSEVRKKIICQGLQNAKRFSWDLTYNEYRKLYEELLNKRRNNATK